MAWYDEMVPLLRSIIGDDGPVSTYSDSRLEDIILNAAYMLSAELDFSYAISISGHTISPDPIDIGDNIFVSLVIWKAGCMIAQAELRLAGNKAYNVKDGPSSIDGRGVADTKKEWAKNICDSYTKAVIDYQAGNGIGGLAIVGPYNSNNNCCYNTERY